VLDNKEVIIIGYSGHGYVVTEAALDAGMNVVYYADLKIAELNPFELKFLGSEEDENFIGWGKNYSFILGIGNNNLRDKIGNFLSSKNEIILSVIHPSANISSKAIISSGAFVARNVSINTLSEIGSYSIINTGAIVEHGCILGESVHIAPGVVLAGNVKIGSRSFIGANSVIKQGVTIGKDVIIGAGSVVITDIPDHGKYVGNPARSIK
jgi:sugar O-acyltransferase (sialic acid O-acetyltransferase NeuD family)